MVFVKQVGTLEPSKEILKLSQNTPTSWSAHLQRTRPGSLSGPDAFRGFTFRKADLISATVTMGRGTLEADGTVDIAPLAFCSKRV